MYTNKKLPKSYPFYLFVWKVQDSKETYMNEGKLLTEEMTKQLRKLLFGSSKGSFNAEWINQNFVFSAKPILEYGLVQHKV